MSFIAYSSVIQSFSSSSTGKSVKQMLTSVNVILFNPDLEFFLGTYDLASYPGNF